MKILREAQNHRKLINDQSIDPNKEYKRFLYTIDVPCENGYRVYNAFTESLIELSQEEFDNFKSLPKTYAPWMDELISGWFIVTKETDPLDELLSLRAFCLEFILNKKEKNYIILPTSACNARCYYCFEYGVKHKTMTTQIADDVVKHILKDHHKDTVNITWFGGEPLVGEKIIDRICLALKKQGLKTKSSIITNGYLFNEEMINKASSLWGLKHAQITIDGTEKVYNQTKAYVNVPVGESPYRRVIKNIKLLLEKNVQVNIRINVGKDNIEDMKNLCFELKKEFKGSKNLFVYPFPIFDNCGSKFANYAGNEARIIEKECRKIAKILNNSFTNTSLPPLRYVNCIADNPSAEIINPDGDLVACEQRIYEDVYGNIYSDKRDTNIINKWKNHRILPICLNCPLLPTCGMHDICPIDRECDEDLKDYKYESVKEAIKKYEVDK